MPDILLVEDKESLRRALVRRHGTRTPRVRPWLAWAWPAFLAAMATVLLFYRET